MCKKELKQKPLIEAVLEVRWHLQGAASAPKYDPHYKLLLARLFDRVLSDYSCHEQLASAQLPDALANFTVQHRFRVAPESWPLIQIGPGILTVNSTNDYEWSDFRQRCLSAVKKLYDAHPKLEEFKITSLVIRYINGVAFDYRTENAYEFLKEKLKLDVVLDKSFFADTGVVAKPTNLTFQSAFKSDNPDGIINVRFATGQMKREPAIIWEIIVESARDDLPMLPDQFDEWIDSAHKLAETWFFKMIDGTLERRFSDE